MGRPILSPGKIPACYTGCTAVDFKIGPDARKPDFGACKQQRHRPVFLSTQSDQRLYCSLIGKFNVQTCLMQNFILTSLCR